MNFFDYHSFIRDGQHDFSWWLKTHLAHTMNEGSQIDIVLLDFSKDFDKVPSSQISTQTQLLRRGEQHPPMDAGLS